MAITVNEKFESRQVTMGTSPSAELRYTIRGTTDDVAARVALEATSPSVYDLYNNGLWLIPRESASVEPVGNDLWEGVVRYSIIPQENESSFAFDTGGGVQHITHSRQTVGFYALGGMTSPDFKGAIGVTGDSVDGVDINVPVYQFSETHVLSDAQVTANYKITLFQLTGRVNSGPWRGFNAGEVLFLGASGSKRGFGPWEITYRFAASPNMTNLAVGPITVTAKKGWEYLWVRYADSEDETAKALVKQPVAAYVEQVYKEDNFNQLGIGA